MRSTPPYRVGDVIGWSDGATGEVTDLLPDGRVEITWDRWGCPGLYTPATVSLDAWVLDPDDPRVGPERASQRAS